MKKVYGFCLLLLALPLFAGNTRALDLPEEQARVYLTSLAVFGTDVDLDFQPLNILDDELGQTHVRLQPILNGLPVYGEQIIVHSLTGTNTVLGIEGSLHGDQAVGVAKWSIDPIKALERQTGLTEDALVTDPELVYLVDEKKTPVVTQMVEVSYEDETGPQRDRLFFDAASGDLLARHPQILRARNRLTYSVNHGTGLPGTLVRTEGSPNSGDLCLDNAHNYAGTVYDYYDSYHGRDSLDDAGLTLVSSVHYSNNYNNAFWTGSQMVYGDGDGTIFSCLANGLDVVAHELTHGVTQYSAALIYSNESGALNEATSDIMAAAVEAAVGGSFTDIWYIGEDIYTPGGPSSDALRYMNNPTNDGVSKDYYPERYTGSSDNGGVHWNSGIANLMFYLLSEGGTHPRGKTTIVVTGIGIVDAARIWYRALTVYMTPSTNFAGARAATLYAASDLFGMNSTQYIQTCRAWAAVGVGSVCDGKSVEYRAHVQKLGWQAWVANGATAGTTGQGLRTEAVQIVLQNAPGVSVCYKAHVQGIGWQASVCNGATAGTTGQSRRMEAIQIWLSGAPAGCSIEYRADVEGLGWLGWVQNGATAGTTGQGRRLEALQVRLVNCP